MQPLLRKSLIVSGFTLGVVVLSAIAATSARSLLSPETTCLAIPAQHGTASEANPAYYYFPSQFRAPEGPVTEPIAAF